MKNTQIVSSVVGAIMSASVFTGCGQGEKAREPQAEDLTDEFIMECNEKAKAGDAAAQAIIGRALVHGWGGFAQCSSNRDEGFRYISLAADAGNASAQCSLGVCYEFGIRVTRDSEMAARLYRKAAEQGNARAQCCLGIFYFYGWGGCREDLTEAFKLFHKSAKGGYTRGQYNLALCYRFGFGVKKNDEKAEEWFQEVGENDGSPIKQNSEDDL